MINIPKEKIERAAKLREAIKKRRNIYHTSESDMDISEEALDSLKHNLYTLEQEYPELITKDSPTQTISGGIRKGFKKIKHKVKQWSFNDIFTEEELYDFEKKIDKQLSHPSAPYFCEFKIDGVKIILEYKNGILIKGATRGDGVSGEDITENVREIKDVPKVLNKDVDIIVEGEAWISKKQLEKINKSQEKKYANTRNLTSGSLRLLDSSIVKERKLNSFIYDIAKIDDDNIKTQEDELNTLKELGFNVNKNSKLCKNLGEIIDFWKKGQKIERNKNMMLTV